MIICLVIEVYKVVEVVFEGKEMWVRVLLSWKLCYIGGIWKVEERGCIFGVVKGFFLWDKRF